MLKKLLAILIILSFTLGFDMPITSKFKEYNPFQVETASADIWSLTGYFVVANVRSHEETAYIFISSASHQTSDYYTLSGAYAGTGNIFMAYAYVKQSDTRSLFYGNGYSGYSQVGALTADGTPFTGTLYKYSEKDWSELGNAGLRTSGSGSGTLTDPYVIFKLPLGIQNETFLMYGDWDYDRAPHYTAYGPYGHRDTTNSSYSNAHSISAWTPISGTLSLHRLTAYPQLRPNPDANEWLPESIYYVKDGLFYVVYTNSSTIGVAMSQVYVLLSGTVYTFPFLSSYYCSGGSGTLADPYAYTGNTPPKTNVNGSLPVLSTTAPNPNIPITITANPAASGETKVYQVRIGSGEWTTFSTTTSDFVTYTPTEADLGSRLYFRIDYNSSRTHEGVTQIASTSVVAKAPATGTSYTPVLPSTTTTVGYFPEANVSLFLLTIKPVFNTDTKTLPIGKPHNSVGLPARVFYPQNPLTPSMIF